MEQKLKKSNFIPLLINSIKGKKNWYLLSTVIIFVTTLLIPYILKFDEEFFIMFGIVETFIIVFVNCMIDNSFLHSDVKLSYYKSKPVTLKKQMEVQIISNLVFTAFLIILLNISIAFQGLDFRIFESFKFVIPWLTVGIFLASLSSILTGNTIMAGAMTVFNFALPAIIYLIINFVFSILENIVIGFSANVLMEYFVNTIYKLEYIYFFKYVDESVDVVYILILGCILLLITLIMNKCIKNRKNENTGNFIVFDGYKYFVAVLASLIMPAAFSFMSYRNSILNKIVVSMILAMLTYYIIIAVIEKSFRISKLSIKVFAISMAGFIALTGSTVAIANKYKNVVPDSEDVEMACVSSSSWILNRINQSLNDDNVLDQETLLKLQRENGITIFTETENIENIVELQNELINNQSYYFGDYYYRRNIVIIYWMSDGSYLIRDYKIDENSEDDSINLKKDEIAHNIITSQEFKEKQYYYLYDENYYSDRNIYCNLRDARNYEMMEVKIDLDELRDSLTNDIDILMMKKDKTFERLLYGNYSHSIEKKDNDEGYILDIFDIADEERTIDTIYINKEFKNTIELLDL